MKIGNKEMIPSIMTIFSIILMKSYSKIEIKDIRIRNERVNKTMSAEIKEYLSKTKDH